MAQILLNMYHSLNSIAGRFYPHYLVSDVLSSEIDLPIGQKLLIL